MWRTVFSFVAIFLLHDVSGYEQYSGICPHTHEETRSCTTQISGYNDTDLDKCKVKYYKSKECKTMKFGPITSNTRMGGVKLKPCRLTVEPNKNSTIYTVFNETVLNITFDKIKWKTIKFRIQTLQSLNYKMDRNQCTNIELSNNLDINEQSVLYYDCYRPLSNGQQHILEFEATDDKVVNRGEYYFNIPMADRSRLYPTERDWQPFIYIELLNQDMKLHIVPPPPELKITAYRVQVMRRSMDTINSVAEEVKSGVVKVNYTEESTYNYSIIKSVGLYHFVVTPLHEACERNASYCRSTESPKLECQQHTASTLNICIVSIPALVLAVLACYYLVLRYVRRRYCTYTWAAAEPPKVLVIYPPGSRLHAECVSSLVSCLREEYGLEATLDADAAPHADPLLWAQDAYRRATHVLYVVGPAAAAHRDLYDRPVTAHRGLDALLLNMLAADLAKTTRKDVMNVFFEHSTGEIPAATKHEKVYFLLKDWQKLIAHLSKNLLPKKQLMRTEKGSCFLQDLNRAKKLLVDGRRDDVMIKFDKNNFEKKVLL